MKILEEIQFQFKQFGNVQNLMKYFSLDELYYKNSLLIKKEIRKLNRKLRNNTNITIINNAINELNSTVDILEDLQYEILVRNYKPEPTRQIKIQKSNGDYRNLGVSIYKDKVVQSIFADILTIIYEPLFLNSSCGYRLDKGCHTALKRFNEIIQRGQTNYIVKADIKSFFDNINHTQLESFLKIIIKDKYFIMYINRFIKSGIFINGKFKETNVGTQQGGNISPILGNIYLHYVLDDWFENKIKQNVRNAELIRYCDDFIACFNNKNDAQYFYDAVESRLAEYNLRLSTTKSQIIPFHSMKNCSFEFLGFRITRTCNRQLLYRMTASKLQSKKAHVTQLIIDNCNQPFKQIVRKLNEYLNSIYSYYALVTNIYCLSIIYEYAITELYRILCHHGFHSTLIDSLLAIYPIVMYDDKIIQF